MKPSYEELEQRCEELQQRVNILEELLRKALARITELEEKLGKNSQNSSKPPSSNQKSNTPGGRKRKRQGHPGQARPLYPPDEVDQHIQCESDCCPHCQSQNLEQLADPFIWQQVELPIVQAIITQYNRFKYRCRDCEERSVAPLPEGVPHSAFGPKLMAFLACLTGRFHLSKREAITLVKDLYGVDLSEGSVINVEENVAKALDEIYHRIHTMVIQGIFPRHFDETSWRDRGKRHYAWIGTTQAAAYYRIDRHRSQEAFCKMIGTKTFQPSTTDRYNAYNILNGPHQYCLAHLIREFHAFAERQDSDGDIGHQIERQLRYACKTHGKWRDGKISKQEREIRLRRSRKRVDELFTDSMASASDELADLCWRLSDEHLWAFVDNPEMEPTNNMAERDLRKLVLWRKKSYGTRSKRGQRYVERITSIVETLKKNGRNVLRFLEEAVRSYYRKEPAPYIQVSLGI